MSNELFQGCIMRRSANWLRISVIEHVTQEMQLDHFLGHLGKSLK